MDISVTTIEMADTTIVGNGDLTLSTNIENGTGPSANSPLIGGYLLIIIDEPHSQEHKDLILQKVAKGLLSWNTEQNLVNLEKELDIITTKAADGEVSRLNERLIQYASENLVTEILINATSNTVLQCIRNLLSSFTRHRHIIHAGYTFAGSGSWILQDGTFSYADMCDALQDTEVQRVFEAYENIVTIDIHCSPEGEWPKLDHEQFVRMCKLKTNPTDVLTAGTPSIINFMKYIEPYVIPMETDTLLESSDVVGNIRFSHPTLYIFPGGQGDSALFGINGFNMLIDGGFARKACFWDFTRHLDRLDAVLITRINNNNVNGITAVLEKKRNQQVYPQIGHVFCNLQERKKLLSPSEDKEKDPLSIDLIEKSQQLVNCLRHINLRPQSCFRDTEPINLYHKVGHGTLNMYVLSPAKESREVREFMEKWNANDNKVFITRKDSKELIFPIQNMISICALLVWEPAKPNENITRILFPGSTPQHKIFEGLDKLKHLDFFKTPVCSANTIVPSKSLTAITKMTKPIKSFDKVIQNDNLKSQKLVTDLKKDKPSPPILDNKQRIENKNLEDNKTKSTVIDNKTKSTTSAIKYPKKTLKSSIKKSESVDSSDKDEVKTDDIKTKETFGTDSETESKKLDEDKKVTKDDQKSTIPKSRSKSKPSKSIERKPRTEIKPDIKPSTPKKVAAEQQGISNKFHAKSSPSATPAKSAKDANNRKVVESKYKSLYSKKEPAKPIEKDQPPKIERKPISRRPKPPSPMRKLGGSPVKSIKLNKNEKDIRKVKTEKSDTVDSSTVSTPVDIDSTKLANEVKLSETEIALLKAQELADLKEEQEVIKEIEAVFSKDEKNKKPEIESVVIPESSIPDEVDEYLIIEKEEFVEYSQDAPLDNGKTETTEISDEPVEKVIEIKQEIPTITQGPSRPTEFTTPITSTTKSKPISLESCNKIETELNEIIQSATDIVKTKEEGQLSYDNDKKEKIEEISRDVSITSPEEKLELSSEKKTTDTKDIDEVENKEADQNYVVESQPDEKFSATSGATTAPTLPEDERITLDEIKEDKVPDIEEKYINEETKEKDLPISIQPTRFEPKPKETDIRAMQFEAQQAHLRDIVKTPDEVADLPVHEEVDGGLYDHGHVEEHHEKDKQVDVDQAKAEEPHEKDVKLDGDAGEKEKGEDQIPEKDDHAHDVEHPEKVDVDQPKAEETHEKDVKLDDDAGEKEKGDDQIPEKVAHEHDVEKPEKDKKVDVDQLKAEETHEKDVKLDDGAGEKEKGEDQIPEKDDHEHDVEHPEKEKKVDVDQSKAEETHEKDVKLDDDAGEKEKGEDHIPEKDDHAHDVEHPEKDKQVDVDQPKPGEPYEKDVILDDHVDNKEKGKDQIPEKDAHEHDVEKPEKDKEIDIDVPKVEEPHEKDVKLDDDAGEKEKGDDQIPEKDDHAHDVEHPEKDKQIDVDQQKAEETHEKDVKLDVDDKVKGKVQIPEKDDQAHDVEHPEKDKKIDIDLPKAEELHEKDVKLVDDAVDKDKDEDQILDKDDHVHDVEHPEIDKQIDIDLSKADEPHDKDVKLDDHVDDKEKDEVQIPEKSDHAISEKDAIAEKILPEKLEDIEVETSLTQLEKTKQDDMEETLKDALLGEKYTDSDLGKEETEVNIDKISKVPIDSSPEICVKSKDKQDLVEKPADTVVHLEDVKIVADEQVLAGQNVDKDMPIKKPDEQVSSEITDFKPSKEDIPKQPATDAEQTESIIKTEDEGPQKQDKVEIATKEEEKIEPVQKLDEGTNEIILAKETTEQMSTEVDSEINKLVEDDIDSTKQITLPEKDTKTSVNPLDDKTSNIKTLSDQKLDDGVENDEEDEDIYPMKETWIRDNTESGELRYSGIPTEFKEPFTSMPYTVNEYTTELRETHITTLDSPRPIEENLEPTVLNNNKQSKLSTLLENSKELMESTSKIISDIKSKDTLKSEQTPSTAIGIDVEKLVANVAVVLKSDKSLEEIASTIKKDTDDSKEIEDVSSVAIKKSYDNEKIKEMSPEPEKSDKVETIPSEKCIKESILNFLNEERKAFDEVEELEVNGELEEEKDYDTEKQTSTIKQIDVDIKDSKYSTQPIEKIDILDNEVSLPPKKDEKSSQIQETSKSRDSEEKDVSSTPAKSEIEEKVIHEIGQKSTTDTSAQEISKPIIPEKLVLDETVELLEKTSKVDVSIDDKESTEKQISLEKPSAEKSISETPEKRKPSEDYLGPDISKSPTPEKSTTEGKASTEEAEKPKSGAVEKSKSPIPSLDQKGSSESLNKRRSIEESEIKETSKPATPEPSSADTQPSIQEEVKRKSIEESLIQDKSKSPTPEKLEEKSTIAHDQSKSPSPEKSISTETAITVAEEKRESIGESKVQESLQSLISVETTTEMKGTIDIEGIQELHSESLDKSKSPTPEKSIHEEKDRPEESEKRKSIISITHDQSKSPSPEKVDSKEKVLTEVGEKRTSFEEETQEMPEKFSIDEKGISEEPEKQKSNEESVAHDPSKSPSPEKSVLKEKAIEESVTEESPKSLICEKSTIVEEATVSTEETREILQESLEKSKSSSPEKSPIDEKGISEAPEKRKSIAESVAHDKSKSPSPQKSMTVADEKRTSIGDSETTNEMKGSIDTEEMYELPSKSLDKSKSSSPEKSTIDEKDNFEEPEKQKIIKDTVAHDQSKSPTPEKLINDTKVETEEKPKTMTESVEKSKSPTPDKSIIDVITKTEAEEKHKSISVPDKSKSPTPEKSITVSEVETEEKRKSVSDSVEKSKSPTPEKSIIDVTTETEEKQETISGSVEKSKSPTPEKSTTVSEVETEEKRKSVSESVEKSKSPTPEKSIIDVQNTTEAEEKQETISGSKEKSISPTPEKLISDTDPEIEEKRKSISESVEKSKSPTPDKSTTDLKTTTEATEIQESISEPIEKSKSPTPEKILTDTEVETEKKPKTISESVEKSKSPTPEKLITDTEVKSEEKPESISASVEKSKSPTPEKSIIDVQTTTETEEKQKSISGSIEKSKSPTPEKSTTVSEVETEDKRKSVSESEEKSKSPKPEKSIIDLQTSTEAEKKQETISGSKEKSKSPTPEKSTTVSEVETEEKRKSVSESEEKSKSPTPEKSIIDLQTSTETEKKQETISGSIEKSKSPTPEKSTTVSEVETEDKRKSVSESEEKSKSPTPEKSIIDLQTLTEAEKKQETISGSIEKSKSPTPEKSTTVSEVETEDKRKSVSESEEKSKSPTPEKSIIDLQTSTEAEKKQETISGSVDKSKSPTPEKSTTVSEVDKEQKRKSVSKTVEKSKSPTPEKSIIDTEAETEEKRKSVSESVEKSKSPTPEKSTTVSEVETEEKQKLVSESVEKSKSPTPEKSIIDVHTTTEAEEKQETISGSKKKSKSPSPEKLITDTEAEIEEERKSISESVDKSKSPTPEKSIIDVKTEAEEKQTTISGSIEKSKSPSPEKSITVSEVETEEKRKSISEFVEKSKSPTPEKSTTVTEVDTEEKRKSISVEKSKSPTPEKSISDMKTTTEAAETQKSISEPSIEKSKSPTPEKSVTDTEAEIEEKRKSISESVNKSKSPTPEKSITVSEVEAEGKRKSISESVEKSKSPSPEKSIINVQTTTEAEEKQKSISESVEKSKSPTPEKSVTVSQVETEEKRKSISASVDKSKSPTPEKSIIDVTTEAEEKQETISGSIEKSKSPTPEKSTTVSEVETEENNKSISESKEKSKSPTPEKSTTVTELETEEKRKSISVEKSKSPTPEKSIIDEQTINEAAETQKSILDPSIGKSKSPTPEKLITETEVETRDEQKSSIRDEHSSTPEKFITEEKGVLEVQEKSKSLDEKSKSPTPEISSTEEIQEKLESATESLDSESKKKLSQKTLENETDTQEKQKTPEESKSPTPEKSISEEKIISETQEKRLITEFRDEKVTADSHPASEKVTTVELDKSKTSEIQESITEKVSCEKSESLTPEKCVPEDATVRETEEEQKLIAPEKDLIEENIKSETNKDSSKSTVIEESKVITESKTKETEKLTNGHQSLSEMETSPQISKHLHQRGESESVIDNKESGKYKDSDKESIEEKIFTDDQMENGFDSAEGVLKHVETFKTEKKEESKTQTSVSTDLKEKTDKSESIVTKIITNGAEISLDESKSSKIVEMNGDSASDITAKPIKTDDATSSTSYFKKTIDTKEIEISHTTNGISDIHETSEIVSAGKAEEFSIIDPKVLHSTVVTNDNVIESSSKITQVADQKERKSISEEKIPGISVDSPIKSTKTSAAQSNITEDGDAQDEGCLSTENLSPLHLSGRSTPEIKIDLDVDRQDEEKMIPLETDKTEEEIAVGTSSTKTDIGITSVIKQSTEDITGNLSGKSTPDIAEVEKLKEELKFEKYISKKTTSPKHTVGTSIKDSETICVMKASKITTEKHELLTEGSGKVIKEEIITTEEKSIERSPDLKLDRDSQHEITIETNTKIIKTVSEETHDVQTNGRSEQTCSLGTTNGGYKNSVLENIVEPITVFSKTSEILYQTSGDMDVGEVSSPPSNMSSGQASCAPNVWDEHFTDEEDLPESPLSVTSQIGSPTSQFQYDTGLNEDTILSRKQMDTMSTSFYGSLPDETVNDHSKTEPVLIPKKSDHFGSSSMAEEQSFIELGTGISKHEFSSTDLKSKITVEKEAELKTTTKDESDKKISKCDEKKVDKPNLDSQKDTKELSEQSQKPSSSSKPDAVESWGKPLGLPSPAPPGETKSTPKKERKTAASILAVKNKKNNERKRSESPGKLNKKISPVYLDLTYVPHHGNANYCYVDFFKKIRARYYVFSGTEPSREVYNALLEAKQTWEDKDLEVTIIPTYDTDVLGYWVAENEELLSKNKIDLSPSASRCTINLQDHETSCSAYRLEF